MKTYKILFSGACVLCVSTAALSSSFPGHFTGNVTMASNYIWRGVSQTENDPAAQSEINLELDNGLYVGLWGSNVNYGNEDPAHVELDYYIGFYHELMEDWAVDVGINQNTYPSANSYNYGEGYLKVDYKFLFVEFDYTNNNINTNTVGSYFTVGAKHNIFPGENDKIIKDIYAFGHVGHFKQLTRVDGGSYNDYQAGIGNKILGADVELSLTNTSGRDRSVRTNTSGWLTLLTVSKSLV